MIYKTETRSWNILTPQLKFPKVQAWLNCYCLYCRVAEAGMSVGEWNWPETGVFQ